LTKYDTERKPPVRLRGENVGCNCGPSDTLKNPYARLPSLSEVAADTIYLENAPVRYDGRPYIVSIGYKMNAIKKRLH